MPRLRRLSYLFLFLLPLLLVLVLLSIGSIQWAASSGSRQDLSSALPVATVLPRTLTQSCAPQVGVTPVATDTPITGAATPTPLPVQPPQRDQTQLQCTGALSVRFSPTQTFTVGRSGNLVRVDIPLCSPSKNARIDMKVTTTGASVRSSTASRRLPRDYSDCAWYAFNFGQPLSVVAGDVLQLQVSSRQNQKSALWAYAGGTDRAVYKGGTGQWQGQTINSFGFQTYIQ